MSDLNGEGLKPAPVPAKCKGKARKYVPNDWIDAMIRRAYQERADAKHSAIPGLKEIAKKAGWPHFAVKKRAVELGVARTKEAAWSERELEILECYAHFCPGRISLKLKAAGFVRSETAVHLKLKRTKLRQNTPYYSANGLAQLFGVDRHAISRWIKLGYLRVKMKGTERTEQQGGDVYLIHHKDVREFVVEHPMECDLRKVDQLWFIDLLVNKGAY